MVRVPEIGGEDFGVVGAVVDLVSEAVSVVIILTDVPVAVAVRVLLVWVGYQSET